MDQDQGVSQSGESVDSRLTALANKFRTPPEPPKQEAEPQVEQEVQTEAPSEQPATEEVPQEEAPEAQPVEDLAEVDYEGEKLKVPSKIKDALLRQADYTRKTQEIAEKRRVVEDRERTLLQTLQLSEQLAPALGQLQQMDQQIQFIQQSLTPQLEEQDPIRFNSMGTKLTLLLNQRYQFAQGLEGHKQKLVEQMTQTRQKAMTEKLADALPKVQQAIKGFSPEMGKQIAEYAKSNGLSQEEIEQASFSAPLVISLWKAREFDRLQAAKPKVTQAVANLPPVAKPGARNAQATEQSARLKEATQQWQKGGGKDADALAKVLRHRLKG